MLGFGVSLVAIMYYCLFRGLKQKLFYLVHSFFLEAHIERDSVFLGGFVQFEGDFRVLWVKFVALPACSTHLGQKLLYYDE